ncbi:MAG: polysaccharide pyruvyl transferase family protein [Eubacterium sp.]
MSFLKFQKNMSAKNISNTSDLNDLYDMFIVGSDQVWHPDVISDDMFLRFAEKKKRATISPSFGLDEIKRKGDYYRNGLCGFNKITVREESGKDIIEGLCDVQVDVNLDPVFMLDSEEWDRVSKPVKGVAVEYL